MIPVLTENEHREADRHAQEIGMPSAVLMERAAEAVVSVICEKGLDFSHTTVVCGTGNNGGDGAAVARMISDLGGQVQLIFCGREEKFTDQMKMEMHLLESWPVSVVKADENTGIPDNVTLIVDAVFGTGIRRKTEGIFAAMIDRMNAHPAPVVSVDMPSGVQTDTGAVFGTAVKASVTVTFTAAKAGLYLWPGAGYAGEICIRKIGIPLTGERLGNCRLFIPEKEDLTFLPKRDERGNKGTFGKILVIAGSEEIAGAAYLSAKAALMCGIGMVRVYTHEINRNFLAASLPEALITTYGSEDWTPSSLHHALDWADAVLVGPGLGTGPLSMKIFTEFLKFNHTKPAVFDADALNMIAMKPELLRLIDFPASATPHVGEMSRLSGIDIRDIKAHLVSVAENAAEEMKRTVILKDARTVTACPDGTCWLNTSGCSALATAGSGDVLAGMVTAFTWLYRDAHLPVPPEALAVWIHGRCGEDAAAVSSESSVRASDLFAFLPAYLP